MLPQDLKSSQLFRAFRGEPLIDRCAPLGVLHRRDGSVDLGVPAVAQSE